LSLAAFENMSGGITGKRSAAFFLKLQIFKATLP
jgi:hypothetical protein